ncbi:RusA family crossover junction endodeoxyribonuclease [Lonsdalea quercina]|uniref:RusA family crossover junction endodeoxyribonuclease n=1 Tax=Lonsdalea quercina TaxID=71657 RepID=UPI003974FADF
MKEYHLKLPWPPSVNTYWRHARGRHYISKKGTEYRKFIIQLIQHQSLDIKTPSRLKISITANAPDRRRRDLDNLQKAVFDSLTHAEFMLDDEQIDDFRVRRGGVEKGGSLDITITELEELCREK